MQNRENVQQNIYVIKVKAYTTALHTMLKVYFGKLEISTFSSYKLTSQSCKKSMVGLGLVRIGKSK